MSKKIIKKIIVSAILVAMLVSNLPVSAFAFFGSKPTDTSKLEIQLDKQFLNFAEFGETKKITAKLIPEGTDGEEIVWESSAPDNVQVNANGNVAWLSGIEPAIITAYLKSNPETKAQCFASFEGTIDTKNNNQTVESDSSIVLENSAATAISREQNEEIAPISTAMRTFMAALKIMSAQSTTIQPQICQGENFTAALKADGTVWTFGTNTEGQLRRWNFSK